MDKEFLEDLFAPFAEVHVKRMFGGIGIFLRGLNFAVVVNDVLHLKSDDQTIADFEAEDMGAWTYSRKDGKITTMPYHRVPERLLDDPDEFRGWAEKAFDAAVRADQAKPPKQRKLVDGF